MSDLTSFRPHNIQPDEIARLRALKGLAVVLLVIMRLDPKPVGETLVSYILGYSAKTSREKLRNLSALGYITRGGRYNGYTLTGMGRQMALSLGENILPEQVSDERPVKITGPLTTTTTLIKNKEKNKSSSSSRPVKTTAPTGKNYRSSFAGIQLDIFDALKFLGVGDRKANSIVIGQFNLEKVQMHIARFVVEHRRGEGKEIAILLTRIQDRDHISNRLADHYSQIFTEWLAEERRLESDELQL